MYFEQRVIYRGTECQTNSLSS